MSSSFEDAVGAVTDRAVAVTIIARFLALIVGDIVTYSSWYFFSGRRSDENRCIVAPPDGQKAMLAGSGPIRAAQPR